MFTLNEIPPFFTACDNSTWPKSLVLERAAPTITVEPIDVAKSSGLRKYTQSLWHVGSGSVATLQHLQSQTPLKLRLNASSPRVFVAASQQSLRCSSAVRSGPRPKRHRPNALQHWRGHPLWGEKSSGPTAVACPEPVSSHIQRQPMSPILCPSFDPRCAPKPASRNGTSHRLGNHRIMVCVPIVASTLHMLNNHWPLYHHS